MENQGWNTIAKRFIAGKTLEEAMKTSDQLHDVGLLTTLDFLGESSETIADADLAFIQIHGMLKKLHDSGRKSHVSVKLTQLGLLLDEKRCVQHMRNLLDFAKMNGQFIRIDMEDSSVTDKTVKLFLKLHEEYGPKHIGIVIQSYLYRSDVDVELLVGVGANVRMVKGAYLEPKTVAYPKKADVDDAYLDLVVRLLDAGNYVAIGSHDRKMIGILKDVIRDHGIDKSRFEFQMLFGIAKGLQKELVEEGFTVRVYTPFGTHWYPYFSRRLAERPANIWFILKNALRG